MTVKAIVLMSCIEVRRGVADFGVARLSDEPPFLTGFVSSAFGCILFDQLEHIGINREVDLP
jgi:hypothetical protein